MGYKFLRIFSITAKTRRMLTLAVALTLAFALAIVLASRSDESFLLLMRAAVSGRVSIVGLLAVTYLPFLFSAIAVYFRKPEILFIVISLKAFLFAFCGLTCVAAFPSGGWLIRLLSQFSDLLLMPVLCWFAVRHLSGYGNLKRDFSYCTGFFVIAGSLDYCLVSPFLVMLIDH